MKKILITGGKGQLAKTFKSIETNYMSFKFVIKSKQDLDITNHESLADEILQNNYDFIINCAAYTDVNKAEEFKDRAVSVNSNSVKQILELINGTNCKLIQFSSDYVFDGYKETEYNETDKVNPVNNYGYSKYLAEKHIINSTSQSTIIRTSWLFSEFNTNFVKKIIDLSKDQKQINVTNKEIGCPTYTLDLANFCMTLCEKNSHWKSEIFNYSNSGFTSRFKMAKKIKNILNFSCKILNSERKTNTDVLRPFNSRLSLNKIKSRFDIVPRDWEEALDICIKKL
nr:SDR family oxidoreductase [Pelagibacteraceae bacterium]